MGKTITSDQMDVHIVHTLTQKRKEERRQILHDIQGKELVTDISEGQASAMKADLGITWWFKQWGIKTESEKKQGIRKGEQIDNKMEEELLPMECTERDTIPVLLLFGDYEFLCKVMGISGASGKQINLTD
ncbi:uncharacterized protein [Porites lutea]|uniref:uncharacterized protein n=1 Tax=Porites lutea TaxID=51062 RepID=UPI003CC57515